MLKVIKNNEQWVYGLNEEQEEKLKEHLTFNNPAYSKALRFSGYSYTNIPPYLTYYEKVKNEKKFKCPLGVNINEVLETDDISFFEKRKQVDVKYPKFLLELREDQEKAKNNYLETLKKEYPQNIIQLPTGKGKAQPLYTKILTPKGFVKMGDIKVGDYIIGSDGRKAKVLGVYPQGKKPVYEITFKDGTKTRCSDEHLWWYRDLGDRRFDREFRVATLKEIMSEPLKVGRAFNLSIPKNKPIKDFEYKVLPLNPYALGCLLGDGCLVGLNNEKQCSCYFSGIEEDIIERLNNSIKSFGKFVLNTHTQCQYIFRGVDGIKNSVFRKVLLDLGVCVKSGEKFIPKSYLYASKEDRFALLQGLFDTDGCIVPNGSFIFSTSSKQLSEDIAFLCRSLGYRVLITNKNRVGKSYKTYGKMYTRKSLEYTVRIQTHNKIFTSKKHLEKDIVACGKHSRQETYKDLIITNIKYVGKEECQCIMVDNEDHTYICDDFVVTHNTILALHIASVLKQKTLILVHKDDLVVGWKKDIELCFGKNIKCGLIKAKKREVGEQITIATVQTLGRMSEEELKSYVNQFGFVVQDEVHHLGLNIFNIINKFNSKYKLGLSATPKRTDGLNFVFDIFLGGICYKHTIRENDEDINNVEVEFIKSPFKYRPFILDRTIYNYYTCDDDIIPKNPCFLDEMNYDKRPRISHLSVDDLAVRNSRTKIRVCKKIIEEYKKGLSLIVLFTQKEHLEIYKKYLIKLNVPENQILMFYGDSTLSSEEIMRKAENKESLITLATYAKATEGTNVKSWEVEFLVSSINNQKNVEQVTGRIRRRKEGKINPVKVYDIVYSDCYSLSRHEDTRLFTYKKLGYKILNANPKKLSGKFNKNDSEDKVKVSIFSRGYN